MMIVSILGVGVHLVTAAEALDRITEFVDSGRPHQVVTLNAEMLYRARHDQALREVINRAHLVTPDGAGVVWAARRLGYPAPERVTGIDLVQGMARRGAECGWRLYLYGAAPGVAEEAAAGLTRKYPGLQIVGTSHGYLSSEEKERLPQVIAAARPQVLLAALGVPAQELWIAENLEILGVPVAVGVGGSLDVIAGRVKRAPAWMGRVGLEWLYRLARQPSRIRRMAVLPRFVWLVLREGRKKKS